MEPRDARTHEPTCPIDRPMNKKKGTVNVRHIASGEEWPVPRDVFSAGNATTWIEQQIRAREQAAAAKAAASMAATDREIKATSRLTELEARLAALEEENTNLRQQREAAPVGPEAAAGAMALMNASAQAQQLRMDLHKDLGAISEWRAQYNEDISDVAARLRRQDATADEERQQRLTESRRMLDQIRIQQGLPPQHLELLEQEVEP